MNELCLNEQVQAGIYLFLVVWVTEWETWNLESWHYLVSQLHLFEERKQPGVLLGSWSIGPGALTYIYIKLYKYWHKFWGAKLKSGSSSQGLPCARVSQCGSHPVVTQLQLPTSLTRKLYSSNLRFWAMECQPDFPGYSICALGLLCYSQFVGNVCCLHTY